MFYFFGLGNPGDKYKNTRHNIAQAYLEYFVAQYFDNDWDKSRSAQARYKKIDITGNQVELIIPETFMNKSGETVRYVVDKHNANLTDLVILHDDVDLPLGEIKFSHSRGDGGHNGIKSIIHHLGSQDFVRLRIGVASRHWWTNAVQRPRGGGPLEKFVLSQFTRREQAQLTDIFTTIEQALEQFVTTDLAATMNKYN